tara:strand:- start:2478 stop:2888 length:411 start_codon:yes stop_codon:yes gene_type:complete
MEWANTPSEAVFVVMALITIGGLATWRNAKGEGWGLITFLSSLLIGFNLSVQFAVWILDWIASTFSGMSTLIESSGAFGDGFGLIAVIIVLGIVVVVMKNIKFDSVRLAALGALYGILLRLFLDFMYFLVESGTLG